METTIAILKENAPFAVMLLFAVLYLDTNMDRDHAEIRAEMRSEHTEMRAEHADIRSGLSILGERMAGVESKAGSIENRLSRVEALIDGLRPLK